MDGNGRWAKQRALPRLEGHRAGVTAVSRAIDACLEMGVRYLTLYSFSSENWKRDESEVSGLMSLFYEGLTEHLDDLISRKVRLCAIGDLSRLPENVRTALAKDMDVTGEHTELTLTLAVSYGSREEILFAAKSIAEKVKNSEIKVADIDEELFSSSLWTNGIPDPDLLIRTSGEMRVSNFLLWQVAYSEIIVIPEYWPEFNAEILSRCLSEFSGRERRFGRTSEQLKSDKKLETLSNKKNTAEQVSN
ncbi:UNVERIFIED_CONTAM: hypothetical protein GTU68_059407 [Idotea baltica]|nr:hypothetical protein [Idotea baltica]